MSLTFHPQIVKNWQSKTDFWSRLLIGLTVVLNILWPLFQHEDRRMLTIAGVIAFSLASLLNAASTQSAKFTISLLVVATVGSLSIELLGVHTGFPFGHYFYTSALGFQVGSVPILITLAWLMMLYPCLLVGRALSQNVWIASALSAWLMATWDLYLDPQMVREGYWLWGSSPETAGTDIPFTNFLGWFLAAYVLAISVHLGAGLKTFASANNSLAIPYCLIALGWVWIGNFVANVLWFAPYFNRPVVALQGFIGMGLVLTPWMWRTWLKHS